MTALTWDGTGERQFESGVDRGVLYIPNDVGAYNNGYAWNGLTTVTESPTGAAVTKKYADNINYLSLISAEEFAGTIEGFTYPPEFGQCDGTSTPVAGVTVGQQTRKRFGLAYRTKMGNDIEGQDAGYKLHLVYGALAEPSQKAYATVNDSPDSTGFSWKFSTTPVDVPGLKPSAILVIDSLTADSSSLAALEQALYGTVGDDPRLPDPGDVITMFSGAVTVVHPAAPTYNNGTHTLTITATTGVVYTNAVTGAVLSTGAHVITEDTGVDATPLSGAYEFGPLDDAYWFFDYS